MNTHELWIIYSLLLIMNGCGVTTKRGINSLNVETSRDIYFRLHVSCTFREKNFILKLINFKF